MQSSQTGAKKALSVVASIALAFAGTVGISSAAHAADAGKVYLNFESADLLGAGVGTFSGTSTTIEESPAAVDGIGGDGNALKIVKAGDPWSGLNVLLPGATDYRYAAPASPVISFDYYAEVASPIMVKLEGGGTDCRKAVEAAVGWNHFSVDMSTGTGWNADKEYNLLALFPDFTNDNVGYTGTPAVAPNNQVFWLDNLSINGGTEANVNGAGNGAPGVVEAVATLLTFESSDAVGALAVGDATGEKPQGSFGGSATTIADAPAGGNGGKALKIVKNGEPYAGVNAVKLDSTNRVGNAAKPVVSFNYYSPKANSPLRVELSPWPNAWGTTITAAMGWQKISIDFSTVPGWSADTVYKSIGIFPDFDVAADGGSYYVDNLAFNGATTPAIVVPRTATSTLLTFESSDALGATVVGDSTPSKAGSYGGATTTIADAPAGGNGGKALKIEKNTGDEVWAGVNMLQFAADTRITNAANKLITFNYYASKAGPVRVEIVPYPVGLGITLQAVQGWQTLSFDMSTATGGSGAVWSADTEYKALALFPDFNLAADNSTFYVDNLAVNGATTPALPVVPTTVAPAMTKAATVSGTAKVGKSLTLAKGTWTGTPAPTYSYKWYRCTVSGSTAKTTAPTSSLKCVAVSGKTSTTYKLAAADKGKYIRALVTVKNSKGTKYSLTKTTAKVS